VVEVLAIQASGTVGPVFRLHRWKAAIVAMVTADSVAVALGVDPAKIAIQVDSVSEAILLFVTGPVTVVAIVPPEAFLLLRAQSPFLRPHLPYFRLPAGWLAVDRNSLMIRSNGGGNLCL
jgi:hypothetical protein